MSEILLCCDLDRTVLPNGSDPESPGARTLLRNISAQSGLRLAYVSGRSKELLQAALDEFDIPVPDFAIGDVGTSIYEPSLNWLPWEDWIEEIAKDWKGKLSHDLAPLFSDVEGLRIQEPEKQSSFKLSFYADPDLDVPSLRRELRGRLQSDRLECSLIWSVDDERNVGLLDILPRKATKLHAIRFLIRKRGFSEDTTVFAGDSGNDLPVLTSGLRSVLVRNARDEVRMEALRVVRERQQEDRLYLAQGGFLGMNGNYSAGVLEGLAHFIPETKAWMTRS